MNRQKKLARSRRDIIIIVGCTLLALIGGYVWTRGFGGHMWFQNFGTSGSASVNEKVLAYEPLIEKYANEYHISDYVSVIEAIMQQESSGEGTDVMQCSECYYNTEYFADCLELAGCRGPGDLSRLKLALQGYNYGHNYINWAIERDGGYTKQNAQDFSDMMKESLGWDIYGDTSYPEHVLRYYH